MIKRDRNMIDFAAITSSFTKFIEWECENEALVTSVIFNYDGEFDPGSGRTLAAFLTHASRTENFKELALRDF